MTGNNDISDMTNPEENYSIFTMLNLCRLFFYTPIVFFSGILGSIAYDYITYKEDKIEDNKKK